MIPETRPALNIVEQAASGQKGYRIERLSTVEDLDQIQIHWSQLAESISGIPLFLTWEWSRSWWRHFGDEHRLCVLAAWDENGELAGLAPLMIVQDRLGLMKIDRLTFLSNGVAAPDHMDMLVRSGHEEVVNAFLEYLQTERGGWDVLDLNNLAPGSNIGAAFTNGRFRYFESSRKQICPYIMLPDSWEAYTKGQLSKKRRQRVRKFAQRFENEFPQQVKYRRIEDLEEVPSAIRFISKLSQAYWESKGYVSAFDQHRFEAFHNELATAAHQKGWLRLYQMEVNGEVVACEYNFRHGNVFYGYQGVFDRKWAEYSPGLVLLAHVFQEAIREGITEFDFLRGDEEYKFYWTDHVRMESRLNAPLTWRGWVWVAGRMVLDRGIEWARHSLSKEMLEKAAKVLSAFQREKQAAD
jgi:CelD/BcsL family acetyltransferase involved in cellulose biosynthesis